MSSTWAQTRSTTSTFSESKAKFVANKIHEDLTALAYVGFAEQLNIDKWYGDILYILLQHACKTIDIKLTKPDGSLCGWRYSISDDNSLKIDNKSGGIRLHSLPNGTKAGIVVDLKDGYPFVRKELERRGWGTGTLLSGTIGSIERTFSMDGYGATRQQIGAW